ncbi:hypothetical protein RBU49_16040 [Clostridium sp. MB40-C1]|uniref:carbonic anhydrase n=1 Tax=Clostridium sp. MB40-C1 TaxID=3070996 RepID=UPI0027E00316|nr:carbonic anhydrase [Clostridium sp. MB40-C1]WMJ80294.1 hypothetical protein RBU49_16040 [Clostridium sp. MB40-C1]
MKDKFATTINCMDGRVQLPVIEYIKREHGVQYIDMITEAGPNKILAENKDTDTIESIKKRVEVSIDKHDSNLITIVGHYDCAGNPVDETQHIKDIKESVKNIKKWNLNIQVIGIYVDDKWKVNKVC